jgi:hypothetical protein
LSGATVEAGEPGLVPTPGQAPLTKSAWLAWTAPADMRIAGEAGCNDFHVYRVDGPGFVGLIPLIDGSNLTLDATAGTQYAFQCAVPYGSNTSVTTRFDQLANHASTTSEGAAPGTVTIVSPQGTFVVNVGVAALSSSELPAGVVDLTGALSYGITGVVPGSTVQVTINLPPGSAPTAAYKLTGSSYSDASSLAVIDGDAVTLQLTDGGTGDSDGVPNGTISDPVVLTRSAAIAIATSSLPNGTVSTKAHKIKYKATMAANGGNPPYTWSLAPSSHLPPGLTMSTTGVISGKATTAGTYSFTVKVVDTKTGSPPTKEKAKKTLSVVIS